MDSSASAFRKRDEKTKHFRIKYTTEELVARAHCELWTSSGEHAAAGVP